VFALAGPTFEPFIPTPVRSAFAYRKKPGRREYLRTSIGRALHGGPKERASFLSSLVETDGLVELPESLTAVEVGQTVAFLAYLSSSLKIGPPISGLSF